MATAIGTILTLRGTIPPFTTPNTTPPNGVFTLTSLSDNKQFNYDDTVFTVVTTRMAQPIQPPGFVAPSSPSTGHSPNLTQEFIVEVLYPIGLGPNMSQTPEVFRLQAIAAINAAFGITLV